jgi:cold shock CspA family protein
MHIFFGIVKNYLPEKGFGFLTHPLSLGPNYDVFFHINKVERFNIDTAQKLSTYKSTDHVCFWYIPETTQKGEQLKKILSPQEVYHLQQEDSSELINKIRSIWSIIEKPIPFWLSEVTIGLLGSNGNNELKFKREALIQKRDEEREKQRIEQDRLRMIEEEKARIEQEKRAEERKRYEEQREKAEEERKRQQEKKELQQKIEEDEFELLVAEMEPKDFTMSHQVSNYIIRNRLGDKYQNISGVLEMENRTSSWKFNGGFPPKIYARLCERLYLSNKGTDSKVTGFISFKDLKNY